MAQLTIDGKEYDIEKISAEAKGKLDSARFCDSKIEQLEAELAITRTARMAYLQALPALLNDAALVGGVTPKKTAPKKAAAKKPAAKKPAAKKPAAKKAKAPTLN